MVEHEKRNNGFRIGPFPRDLVNRSMPYWKAVISIQIHRCLSYVNAYGFETLPSERMQKVPEAATKVEYGSVPWAVDVQPLEDIAICGRREPQTGIPKKCASFTQPVGKVLQVVAGFEPSVCIVE